MALSFRRLAAAARLADAVQRSYRRATQRSRFGRSPRFIPGTNSLPPSMKSPAGSSRSVVLFFAMVSLLDETQRTRRRRVPQSFMLSNPFSLRTSAPLRTLRFKGCATATEDLVGSGVHRVLQRLEEEAQHDRSLARHLKKLAEQMSSVKS